MLINVLDEIKWQLRMPNRFAQSEAKLTYLSKVEEETINFLSERIKHNYLKPEEGLNLDLKVKDAEILISANQNVKDLADRGELEKLHKRCVELENTIESDYLAVRNHIGKILLQIEEKENALVD